MELHDAVRKIELSVSSPYPRHVAVDDRAEFFTPLRLKLARLVAVVGDEFAGEHPFAAEGVFMAARHGQQIDQRVKVPQPVLDGCGR